MAQTGGPSAAASVKATVKDKRGNPMPNATIELRNDTGAIKHTFTGDAGTFLITGLHQGNFTVGISAEIA